MNEPVCARDAGSAGASPRESLSTELLILPDGRILVHNLTPAFAALLSALNPADEQIRQRVNCGEEWNDRQRRTDH